jgi:hypothetical protein
VPDDTVATSADVRRCNALPVTTFTRQGWRLELLCVRCEIERTCSRTVRGTGVLRNARVECRDENSLVTFGGAHVEQCSFPEVAKFMAVLLLVVHFEVHLEQSVGIKRLHVVGNAYVNVNVLLECVIKHGGGGDGRGKTLNW